MKKTINHNSLFMIELIISIFFFIICASVCLEAFVKAHNLSKKSEELNHALNLCQNLTSLFYQIDPSEHEFTDEYFFELASIFQSPVSPSQIDENFLEAIVVSFLSKETVTEQSQIDLSQKQYFVYLFDEEWNPCNAKEESSYFALCTFSSDSHFYYEQIVIGKNLEALHTEFSQVNSIAMSSSKIYAIQQKKYIGG